MLLSYDPLQIQFCNITRCKLRRIPAANNFCKMTRCKLRLIPAANSLSQNDCVKMHICNMPRCKFTVAIWPAANKVFAKWPAANSILYYDSLQIQFCKMALCEITHRPAANWDLYPLQIHCCKMTAWKFTFVICPVVNSLLLCGLLQINFLQNDLLQIQT